jgi:PAS domain S-box-containing protein
LSLFRWLIPLSFSLIATTYQLGIAKWVHDTYGENTHYTIEILFFATVGPLLAFWVLSLIDRWLKEKDLAEDQARISERRLAAITSASADAIISTNLVGEIESWNRGAYDLFGYSEVEMLSSPISRLLAGEGSATVEMDWVMKQVRGSGFIRGYETTCRDVNGQLKMVELTATALEGISGEMGGTSIILRDITARKKRDEEIRQLNQTLNLQVRERTQELAEKVQALAQANQELQTLDQMRSEFVSLVSHQIRAPLTNMRGAVTQMQAGCGNINSICSNMFMILEQQVARLDRLVVNILNAAQIEAEQLQVQLEPISILPLVSQVFEQTLARPTDRTVHLPTKPGIPLIYADRDQLAEALTNILDNADKYSPPGAPIDINVRANQSDVVVSVRDSGPGLPEDDLERVFNKFYRPDSSDSQAVYGYGLGLYVCRSLVEAQGGQVWAENHPSGGAEFSISIPVWRENRG